MHCFDRTVPSVRPSLLFVEKLAAGWTKADGGGIIKGAFCWLRRLIKGRRAASASLRPSVGSKSCFRVNLSISLKGGNGGGSE